MKERIQKLIAVSGLCSRRAAEELLRAGRVSVNGAVAALGAVADPAVDLICVDGQPLPAPPEKPTTVLLYKPRGVVTTLSDEKGRRTVAELLPPELGRLYPVGRLDQFSEGLLLMTNDGALANRLTHPSGEIRKTYQLWVSGWHDAALPLLRRPITLDGRPIAPPEVRLVWAGTGNRERAYDAVGSDAHIAPVIASGNDAAAPRRLEASGDASLRAQSEKLANQGKTPLLFAHGDRLLGLIAVADTIKPESPEAVRDLQNMGLKVIMLTGDNERTAKAIASQAGVDEVIAGVLPEGKEAVIRQLQSRGPVLMVGDGINDAPALTRADVGVAIGAGTDVAIDAADVVLMKSKLSDVPAALRLSRATLRNIHENLFWAFIYNTIGIPLAAGAFVKAFGWTLNPMFGAAAMSLSSFCVVTNALRLNFVKLHKEGNRQYPKGHRQATGNREGRRDGTLPSAGTAPTIQIAVKGMMCHNCERHVKEALEALPGVDSAEANFETGLVTLRGSATEAEMKQAVKSAGYQFRKIVK